VTMFLSLLESPIAWYSPEVDPFEVFQTRVLLQGCCDRILQD
jgi:hypothetical protein